MWKKALPLLLAPLLLAGCATSFTNLTARHQPRNANNLYPVEVQFHTRQKTLRWDHIQPFVKVGSDFYPLRPTMLMTNRWEGLIPVPADGKAVSYRYKFEYKYNVFGKPPQPGTLISPEYKMQILEQ